jgi:NAD(P) transhydrogenase subunit beta
VTLNTGIDLVYLLAAVGFIMALKGLSSPKHARNGNLLAAAAAALAVGFTFAYPAVRAHSLNLILTLVAMAIGAAVLVSIVVFLLEAPAKPAVYRIAEVLFGVLVGCVSFAGSAIAFAKLQELMTGRPVTYPAQQVINAIVALAIVALAIGTLVTGSVPLLVATALLSLVLGVIFVLPIGGADVPVLISLLNSFTGLAVAASGFTLNNNLLIIAGTLVGASGMLLTRIMSKAMGRSLANVLFSAFGSVVTAGGGADGTGETRTVRSGTPEDIGVLLAYARKVVIIPGYGLAVAQAQHTVRELADLLMERGVEVFYAIHPVAGRMPGHMNVLLAEANVPYDQLKEMDEANPEMATADVALVVGANDTVNPAAKNTPGSPIYGMPIVHADEAENIVFLKRSMRPGFAGIDNELLFDDKTTLLFGDAKDTLTKLVAAVKAA